MNKNIAIVIGLVVVVAVGLMLWISMDEASDASPEETARTEREEQRQPLDGEAVEALEVVYTEDGFEPATITVSEGDTVTWENRSDVPMWVASDPHPSHTDYPEFDASEGFAPGSSYSFTFDRTGNWGYHDHLSSFRTGTVIVE